MPVDDRPEHLTALLAALRVASIAPLAMELASPLLASRVGAGRTTTLLVRLAGNAASVRAQRRVLDTFGDVHDMPGDVWTTVRTAEPPSAIVARLSARPSRMASVWTDAREATAGVPEAMMIASVGRGIARCVLPETTPDVARQLARCEANVIFERLPAALWSEIAPSPVSDRLSRDIRERFDPAHVLNPGLLGEAVAR
jgi:hypothetical protein